MSLDRIPNSSHLHPVAAGYAQLTAEQALMHAYATHDDLQADLDRLAVHVEKLLRERAHILEVLSAFYRSDISMSSLQPVLDLCCEVNPALRTERRR